VEVCVKNFVVRSIAVMGLAALTGCASHTKTVYVTVPCVDSGPYEPGPTSFAAVPTSGPAISTAVPSPVLKLVHQPVPPNTNPAKIYYAMVSPFPPNLSTNLRPPVDARQVTYQGDWAAVHAGRAHSMLPFAPASAAPAGFGVPDPDEYQVAMLSVTIGTGWIYLTGERPIVKTTRVIGAADGTTFICQIAERDGIEYHRFGLFFPSGSSPTDAVTLSGTDTSGTTTVQINQTLPYAVYVYDTSTSTGSWVTSGTVGTGNTWDNFARAIADASRQAGLAELPVP
jgi:hypothetical protein